MLYLPVIWELHSRRVSGRCVSDRIKRDLAIRPLNRATALRHPPKGCIHHTDRGGQYCSTVIKSCCVNTASRCRCAEKGNGSDISAVEVFFTMIKAAPI